MKENSEHSDDVNNTGDPHKDADVSPPQPAEPAKPDLNAFNDNVGARSEPEAPAEAPETAGPSHNDVPPDEQAEDYEEELPNREPFNQVLEGPTQEISYGDPRRRHAIEDEEEEEEEEEEPQLVMKPALWIAAAVVLIVIGAILFLIFGS